MQGVDGPNDLADKPGGDREPLSSISDASVKGPCEKRPDFRLVTPIKPQLSCSGEKIKELTQDKRIASSAFAANVTATCSASNPGGRVPGGGTASQRL